jgi:chorismate mutase
MFFQLEVPIAPQDIITLSPVLFGVRLGSQSSHGEIRRVIHWKKKRTIFNAARVGFGIHRRVNEPIEATMAAVGTKMGRPSNPGLRYVISTRKSLSQIGYDCPLMLRHPPTIAGLGNPVCHLEMKSLSTRKIEVSKMKKFMKTTRLVLAFMTLFAAETPAGTQDRLAGCRRHIDALDQRIVELLQQRARVVEEVGNIKREAHLPVTVPSREAQVVERAQELAKGGPLPPEAVGRIYQKLLEEMRNWEIKLDAGTSPSPSQPEATGGSK